MLTKTKKHSGNSEQKYFFDISIFLQCNQTQLNQLFTYLSQVHNQFTLNALVWVCGFIVNNNWPPILSCCTDGRKI